MGQGSNGRVEFFGQDAGQHPLDGTGVLISYGFKERCIDQGPETLGIVITAAPQGKQGLPDSAQKVEQDLIFFSEPTIKLLSDNPTQGRGLSRRGNRHQKVPTLNDRRQNNISGIRVISDVAQYIAILACPGDFAIELVVAGAGKDQVHGSKIMAGKWAVFQDKSLMLGRKTGQLRGKGRCIKNKEMFGRGLEKCSYLAGAHPAGTNHQAVFAVKIKKQRIIAHGRFS
jgi:hypothetical protein